MTEKTLKILLVEDDPGDARLIFEMFKEAGRNRFTVEHKERLDEALAILQKNEFDLVILDLGLPDSSGLETFFKVFSTAPRTAVVIMSGLNDEAVAEEAVSRGAQDYLVKGRVDAELLIRSIRYAVERNKMIIELERLRLKEQEASKEVEFRSMEKFSERSGTTVTSRMFGIFPIKDALPDLFAEKVKAYSDIIDKSMQQKIYNEEYNVSDNLKMIAEDLGFMKASPQDVLDIHLEAVKEKLDPEWTKRNKAYIEEGRLLVLELMGFLVLQYRRYSLLYNARRNEEARSEK